MTTESVASESLPVENVLDAPVETADADPPEAPVVAAPTPAPEAGETPVKKQEGFSKRIDELTRDFYGEKRARERAEDEARTLRQQLEAAKPKPVEPAAPPRLEDFGFDEEKHRLAILDYVRTQGARAGEEAAERKLNEREAAQKAQAKAATFAERETLYKAKHPDYQNKVYSDNVPISDAMYGLILDSELGPELAEYLADNTDLARQIYQLKDPVLIGREMGRIEAKLEKPPATPVIVPKVSSAPPPPPKIEAKDAAPPKSIDDPKISDAEFARIRRNQIAQRR